MILATTGGDVAIRTAEFGGGVDRVPRPGEYGFGSTVAGRRVTVELAAGLPAILSGIRLLAETTGAMPLHVYEETYESGSGPRAAKSDQWRILNKRPNEQQTPFGFVSFLIASLNGWGGALALKAMAGGVVQALYPLAPRRWYAYHGEDNVLHFKVRTAPGKWATLDQSDAIYVPGILLDDPYIGVSPITEHANAIGIAIGTEEYAGRFYDNDATPSGALEMPFNSDSQQAKDMREFWEDRHRGGRNAHRVAALFGGAKYQQIGVSAQDAQIVEAQRWNVEQAARVLRLPPWALGVEDRSRLTPEQKNLGLLQLSCFPWMTRVEQALNADEDLFPVRSGLCCGFDADYLMRADMAARYTAYLQGRQAGWLNVDEIREEEGREPLPNGAGQEYQTTPVGGAPNLQPGGGGVGSEGGPAPAPTPEPVAASAPVHVTVEPADVRVSVRPEIHVPKQPAPYVDVHVPAPGSTPKRLKFTKDRQGRVDGIEG